MRWSINHTKQYIYVFMRAWEPVKLSQNQNAELLIKHTTAFKLGQCYSNSLVWELWNFIFSHFFAILRLSRDEPVVLFGGNRCTRRKPPPNPKSLANLSHAPGGIRTQRVVRDSWQSVTMPSTTRPSGHALSMGKGDILEHRQLMLYLVWTSYWSITFTDV